MTEIVRRMDKLRTTMTLNLSMKRKNVCYRRNKSAIHAGLEDISYGEDEIG